MKLRLGSHNSKEILTGLEPNTGHYVAYLMNEEDGARIVKLVNLHDEAAEIIENLLSAVDHSVYPFSIKQAEDWLLASKEALKGDYPAQPYVLP